MAIADLVEAIRAELQQDTQIEWVSGHAELDGGIARRNRGYIRVEGFARSGDNADWENVDVRARLYLQYVEPRSDEEPVDPAEVYRLGELLRDALQNRRTITDTDGTVWLLAFLAVDYDHDVQGAEATIMAGRENPFES